ncbi:MAG: NINE protein, partial [Gammaproteobacteria bacterium]|nr:NINE protein [Gammaproteobacteria bacterium]
MDTNTNMTHCKGCGKEMHNTAVSCPGCGATTNQRNRIVAALLAIFLGGFGIHKFYLGKTGQGILYLL